MHVEPPGHAPTNLKELGIHYLMIVVGILTALGLEAGIETLHHQRLARHTSEQVELELLANHAEARAAIEKNRQSLAHIEALYNDIKAMALSGHVTPDWLREALEQRLRSMGIVVPGMRRDAWETAVADQALVHLPHEQLRRYSEVYTAQRDAQQAIWSSMQAAGPFSRLTDVMVEAELNRADAVETLKALSAYRLALRAVLSTEYSLEGQLAESLHVAALPPPLAASAAPVVPAASGP
jgi:peptidoglycan/xylan/chitin deacetylase (PgdA/CDA1 family)